MDRDNLKKTIKGWLLKIDKEDILPDDIIALNFGLYEPYGIELIGAEVYDPDDDDWACEEDFEPKQRSCDLNIPKTETWEDVLNNVVIVLKELMDELKDIQLLNVRHITTGFSDGDLVVVK